MSRKGDKKSFQTEGRVIFFATNNVNKFNEGRKMLAECDIAVGMLRTKSLEIQSESLDEIAKASAVDAYAKCHLPIIVEDAGLFTDALNGFPGPYAAYAYETIGNQGLLRLMQGIRNRKAHFDSALAYFSADLEYPICFHGRVDGEIATEERKGRNKSGFGFDPIFRPGSTRKTFAEMSILEKNEYSHRARAFRNFAEWYKS
jgi:XTP/dITP diphosphohydrolase